MENTGILPLLQKKLKKIVMVDGGYSTDEKRYGDDLLKALMLARTELNCSFIGQGGRDVISDLLDTFVKPNKPDVRKPRYYRYVFSHVPIFFTFDSKKLSTWGMCP